MPFLFCAGKLSFLKAWIRLLCQTVAFYFQFIEEVVFWSHNLVFICGASNLYRLSLMCSLFKYMIFMIYLIYVELLIASLLGPPSEFISRRIDYFDSKNYRYKDQFCQESRWGIQPFKPSVILQLSSLMVGYNMKFLDGI